MLTPSILRSLKYSATLKSHPPSGSRSGPSQSSSLMVAPVDAVTPDVAERFLLETPLQFKQTFAYTQTTITPGMFLVVGTQEYPIKGVAPYPEDDGYTFYQLILEDLSTK